MLTEQALKDQLHTIALNDFNLPDGIDHWALTREMLAHLGSIDPELRDGLIYHVLVKWAQAERYAPDQYRAMLNILLDDQHLFLGLGERNTDSVFMRAFSILVSTIPVYGHRLAPFLTQDEVRTTLDTVLRYLEGERDLRGYVEVKGWAHAAAHSADVLDELAQCEEIERDGLLQILEAIKATMSIGEVVFTHEEAERMAYATLSLIQRGLLIERDIEPWLRSFAPIEPAGGVHALYRRINIKTFLRSLFFQSMQRHIAEWITVPIDETLYAISNFK